MLVYKPLILALTIALTALSVNSANADETDSQFRNWDRNRDGMLSRDELPQPLRKNFARVDADNDGFISPQELSTARGRNQTGVAAFPKGTRVLKDLSYIDAGHERQKLNLYVPPSDKPLPLVIWIHGGAWMSGSKDNGPFLPLLSQGFAVASINYRLSQHAKFPAQIHDCKAAVRWLKANAADHNIDAARIGVWGSSAGGHLVALLGTGADVSELEDPHSNNSDVSSRVQAVCDWFGPVDFSTMNQQAGSESEIDHDSPDAPEAKLIGGPVQLNHEAVRLANPATWASSDDPPFLIMHGDRDRLVPSGQSDILHAALLEQQVDSTLRIMKGSGHGFSGTEPFQTVLSFFVRTLQSDPQKN